MSAKTTHMEIYPKTDAVYETIKLRGDEGLITVGGNETDGYIFLYDKDGNASTKIFGFSGGQIQLYDKSTGESITLSGGNHNIILQDTEGRNSIALDGEDASITAGSNGHAGKVMLQDTEGRNSIALDGEDASITAGSNGHAGKVMLQDTANRNSITLDGNTGGITLLNERGNSSITLDAKTGDVVLHDKKGQHSFGFHGSDDYAGLWIGANKDEGPKSGYIAVRDSRGYEPIIIDGDAGNITLNNLAGDNSIIIDGDAGDIILNNADCAEEFEMSDSKEAEPGTVMVIVQEDKLEQSRTPYDKRVVGVISGAGDHKPGLVLDRKYSAGYRKPVALMGKVYCKVDAESSSIEVGDLLTTSSIPGHAMKVADPLSAFGAVIGKALRPLKAGLGIIPILIALQ